MKLPDGTVLMHGSQPYDPKKAREYYLRTRKLKGRKKGKGVDPAKRRTAFLKKLGGDNVHETAALVKRMRGLSDEQMLAEAKKNPKHAKAINTLIRNRQRIRSSKPKTTLADIEKEGRRSKGTGEAGKLQQRQKAEEAKKRAEAARKKSSDQKTKQEAAAKEVDTARKELADLNEKFKAAKDTADKESLKTQIVTASKKLADAVDKQKATRNG